MSTVKMNAGLITNCLSDILQEQKKAVESADSIQSLASIISEIQYDTELLLEQIPVVVELFSHKSSTTDRLISKLNGGGSIQHIESIVRMDSLVDGGDKIQDIKVGLDKVKERAKKARDVLSNMDKSNEGNNSSNLNQKRSNFNETHLKMTKQSVDNLFNIIDSGYASISITMKRIEEEISKLKFSVVSKPIDQSVRNINLIYKGKNIKNFSPFLKNSFLFDGLMTVFCLLFILFLGFNIGSILISLKLAIWNYLSFGVFVFLMAPMSLIFGAVHAFLFVDYDKNFSKPLSTLKFNISCLLFSIPLSMAIMGEDGSIADFWRINSNTTWYICLVALIFFFAFKFYSTAILIKMGKVWKSCLSVMKAIQYSRWDELKKLDQKFLNDLTNEDLKLINSYISDFNVLREERNSEKMPVIYESSPKGRSLYDELTKESIKKDYDSQTRIFVYSTGDKKGMYFAESPYKSENNE